MREILFRGKRINGEWEFGSLSIRPNGEIEICNKCVDAPDSDPMWQKCLITHLVIPETVGQYTGLTDKNGKKIFEGDIVELVEDYDDIFGVTQTSVEYGVVVWYEDYYCWGIKFEDVILSLSEIMNDYFVCVGNIHDNPELLKGGVPE